MFVRLGHEASNIVKGVIEIVYFMRGAISYDEMMVKTPGERQFMEEFLHKRLETQKNSPHPVY